MLQWLLLILLTNVAVAVADWLTAWLVLPLFVACFWSRFPLLYTGQYRPNFQLQWVTEADAALETSPLTVCTFYSPLPIPAPSAALAVACHTPPPNSPNSGLAMQRTAHAPVAPVAVDDLWQAIKPTKRVWAPFDCRLGLAKGAWLHAPDLPSPPPTGEERFRIFIYSVASNVSSSVPLFHKIFFTKCRIWHCCGSNSTNNNTNCNKYNNNIKKKALALVEIIGWATATATPTTSATTTATETATATIAAATTMKAIDNLMSLSYSGQRFIETDKIQGKRLKKHFWMSP